MSNANKPILSLHREHLHWLHELNFFQDEIKFFQNKLFQVVLNHSHLLSIEEHVAEYRNIFLKKLHRIDDLRHQIYQHERKLRLETAQSEQAEDHVLYRKRFERFVEAYLDMKKSFLSFVSHNMD